MTRPGETLLGKALAGGMAEISGRRGLAVVQMDPAGIVVWKVKRDLAGVPRARSWPPVSWMEIRESPISPEAALVAALRIDEDDVVILVSALAEGAAEAANLEPLRRARPDLQYIGCESPVAEVLKRVIADEPLTQMYEFVTLRKAGGGKLELGCIPLFPVGAQRGDSARLTVRCTASAQEGTTFAVVAISPRERVFRPVVIRSVPLEPGVYSFTAHLERPGSVRFTGLPAHPVREQRSWTELIGRIPDWEVPRDEAGTEHLICAIEISASHPQSTAVAERISRARRFLGGLLEREDRLEVSVIAYGSHAFDRGARDLEVDVLCWRRDLGEALERLNELEEREPETGRYPLAARLECVLAEVASRLPPDALRTALLAVGDRPPFPARAHRSGILPCPRRHDWERLFADLRDRRKVVFAAMCDTDPAHAAEFWRRFGGNALVGPRTLAQDALRGPLKLSRAVRGLPFPLTETE